MQLSRFKAVVFDMDGVLVDTEFFYMKQLQAFSDAYGLHITHNDFIEQFGASHDNFQKMLARLLNASGEHNYTQEEAEQVFEKWAVCMPRHYAELMFDGVEDTLRTLNNAGLRVALASSAPMHFIKLATSECGIQDEFEIIVSGEQFRESKPNPEIYLHTAECLGLDPSECCCVEDSTIGIEAGKSAGYTVIARRETRIPISQEKADVLVDNIPGILPVILDK